MRKLLSLLLTSLLMLAEAVSISCASLIERPNRIIAVEQRDENVTVGDEGSVSIGVDVHSYHEDWGDPPYNGHDGFMFNVVTTSNVRKGIEYEYSIIPSLNGLWYEVSTPTGLTDDSVAWLPLPWKVTFFGGPGVQNSSAEYNAVWVSSNGFLSFSLIAPLSSPVPMPIPDPIAPDNMIAAYWADLDPTGGSITYGETPLGFTVEWKNVLNKYDGSRLTFQIVITYSHYPVYRGQNAIYLLYHTVAWAGGSVSGIPPPEEPLHVNLGIEDQEGCRGIEPPYVNNWQGIKFSAKNPSPEIRSLNILMSKNDANAQLKISTERWSKKGQNTRWTVPQPGTPSTSFLAKAIYGGDTLLISTLIGAANPAAGFICGATLLTMDLGIEYYEQNYEKKLRETDPTAIQDEISKPGTDFAYLNASAATDAYGLSHPVDALVGTEIYWIFLDDNSIDHVLTLTAQLQYYSNAKGKIISLETSVTLRVYIGRPATPARPTGSGYGYLGVHYSYSTSTTTPDSDSIYYQFDWDDGSYTTIGPYPSGTTVSASHAWWYPRWYYVKVRAKDSSYGVWSGWSPSCAVIIIAPGDGGGCPYVSVWNGTHYVLDNNLIPGAEGSNGTDVTDYYMLQQPLIRSDGKYSLMIWDLDKRSFLDQARLLAVDHESDVNIAVSPYGDILTYRNPAAPVAAIDQNGQDVTSILSSADGDFFEGYVGHYITLDFGSLDVSKGTKLVFRADYCSPELPYCKESIHVQVSNADGEWINASSFIPRMYWSTDIIDMADCLPDINGDLKVRLLFTAYHKIDYVGLDTSKQGKYELRYGSLATANHSRLGDVKELFQDSDNQRVELMPSEQVTLQFTMPQNTKPKRDFIIILEGHYFIIS